MESNKNRSLIILLVIIIGVLVCALVIAFLLNYTNKRNINLDNNTNIVDDVIESKDEDNSNEVNNSNSSTNDNITFNESSKQEPLDIGEWGVASKYISGGYVDVPVRVTNVTRGNNAAEELRNYLDSGTSIYKYSEPKENMEWAIIEYDIDMTKLEKDSTVKMDTKITGTGDNTSVKYKGVTYILSTINMTSNKYTKGGIESCKFAVQLPIGCVDYLIVLGTSSNTQAFFYGK